MAKIKQIIFIFILLYNFSIYGENLIVGAERTQLYLPLLEKKNVAIVGNHTSLIKQTHLVDSLLKHNINIVKVFSPEHGFRGKRDAGEKINNEIDKKTGIGIISLYGKNKKPKKSQLKNIDIIIFDIQDVGARFYTYISTMHYVLEAASEENKKVIILDRPNPNGHYIDGPILENNYKSFVGMHKVPIVHGMTIGEYATMIVGEKWIKEKCDLTIIKMLNYNRKIAYKLSVKPSPNLPNSKSINLYPSLCLFEGTNVNIGRGTEKPFQHFGSPQLIHYSYSFIPKSGPGSKHPKHENKTCYGVNLESHSFLSNINLDWLIEAYNQTSNKEDFFNSFFDKLAGTEKLKKQIISGKNTNEIKETWKVGLNQFKKIRKKYLLY
tara:strand:+ start:810 stop:1949 length:1140 start_codon:yes stop_codon:yes gene_type:complete